MKRLVILLLLSSCVKTDIINEVEPQLDTVVMQKQHRPLPPPIDVDTTRVQMGFNPTVEDWEETNL
jgi:hypothetical protein